MNDSQLEALKKLLQIFRGLVPEKKREFCDFLSTLRTKSDSFVEGYLSSVSERDATEFTTELKQFMTILGSMSAENKALFLIGIFQIKMENPDYFEGAVQAMLDHPSPAE